MDQKVSAQEHTTNHRVLSLPLGYSRRYGIDEDEPVLQQCFGPYTQVRFRTELIARSVRLHITGDHKGLQPVDLELCSPCRRTNRLPNGSEVRFTVSRTSDHIIVEFTANA